MTNNKTKPTDTKIEDFLTTVSERRAHEAQTIMKIMQYITGQPAVMWGSSIIGFGTVHYRYNTGREGDVPLLGFSPRKASLTIYFMEGFELYKNELSRLGKYKISKSCLYITRLAEVDIDVLKEMLKISYKLYQKEAA